MNVSLSTQGLVIFESLGTSSLVHPGTVEEVLYYGLMAAGLPTDGRWEIIEEKEDGWLTIEITHPQEENYQ